MLADPHCYDILTKYVFRHSERDNNPPPPNTATLFIPPSQTVFLRLTSIALYGHPYTTVDIAPNIDIVRMAPNLQSLLLRATMIEAVFAFSSSALTKLTMIIDEMNEYAC